MRLVENCDEDGPALTTSSRDIAFRVLEEHRETSALVSELLENFSGETKRDNLRLASEIVHSTIRRRATLDAILAAHVNRPADQVERGLWTLLRIGVCQIVLLETPMHAAVHETVETARRCGNPRWTGFLNGTLRAIARTADREQGESDKPGRNCVPLTNGRYRLLNRDVFPDPETNLKDYIATAHSFPEWMVDRWLSRMTKQEVMNAANWFNASPRLTLRANTLVTTPDELIDALDKHGINAGAGTIANSVRLSKRYAITGLPGFDDGWFAVQDESAMAASLLLAPKQGERVLDLCAGSGSKTCHLAAIMQNEGTIVAVDTSERRLERLQNNTQRLGISIVEGWVDDGTTLEHIEGTFDAALVDVPCSNTGVLAKRAEVRWRLSPEELPELVQLQLKLLTAAFEKLKSGGRLVYSTCSCEPDENELLLRAFVELHPDATLEADQHHAPGQPGDGAYQGLLRKS